MKKVMLVFGTRPEAIKMCPLVNELKKRKELQTVVCVTGQHRQMLDMVLEAFSVTPDYDLSIMKDKQTLFDVTTNILNSIKAVLEKEKPDVVLVHGDTSTTFVTALACFYMQIPVGHVEAGLRTYNIYSPYPEEFNRQAVSIISKFNFAPTELSKQNLLKEGKDPASIYVTGNTAIDALKTTVRENYTHPELEWAKDSRLIMITAHRRENLGEPMCHMFKAIRRVMDEHPDVKAIYPIHMNPAVRETANEYLGNDDRIKLIDCYGEKMPEETLLLVEDYIDGKLHVFDKDWPELPFAHREHIGRTVDYVAGRNRYMGYLISLGIYSFKGVKVGLDCANGSSWNIAKSVFDALGADTYVINNKPNGLNINNNAGSTHIEGLQKFVVENGLDVGFAFDGDADRCLCVDEKGNVITGDHILYIYGCYMKEHGELMNNTVVTTVMSNFGLYKAFDEKGIGYAKTAVGDKYVYEYMAKNGCRIGGEQSGHIIFSKYASTGDGILTSLKMMEVMLAKKMPMSKLAEPLKIYPQVLENVRVTDKKAAQNDPAVQEAVKAVAEALGDTGRILVRESGTEPVVRVMVEAPEHDTCQKYVS